MTTYVTAFCHCSPHRFRVAFDTDSLPIISGLCHCSTCRHTTGQLASWTAPFKGVALECLPENGSRCISPIGSNEDEDRFWRAHPSGIATPNGGLLAPPTITINAFSLFDEVPYDVAGLAAYDMGPNTTRYFCKVCSAHLLQRVHAEGAKDMWSVSVGSLKSIEGIVKLAYHKMITKTLDGGLADQLRVVDGIKVPRYSGDVGSTQVPIDWRSNAIQGRQTNLPVQCHCGAIKFEVTKPSAASFDLRAPYPDLLHPYDVGHLSKISNPHHERWWLRPLSSTHPTQYLAGNCMCHMCRLCSGSEVV